MSAPLRIVQLTASNVKRLKAVDIRPNGDLVVIAGKNGAGKSSVLDCIAYALGGKATHPSEPVRRGAKSAEIVLDLDQYVVRRTFTAAGGSTITVTAKDGVAQKSPQSLIDTLYSSVGFDPLAFSRESPKRQAEILREISGLDTSEIDARRADIYEQRTEVGRRGNEARAIEAQHAFHADVPAAEVSVRDLLRKRDGIVADQAAWSVATAAVDAAFERAEKARQELACAEKSLRAARARMDATPEPEEFGPIDAQLAQLEEINRKVRENSARAKASAELRKRGEEYAALTARIDEIDERKAEMVRAAKMPIDGLGIGDRGEVTFGGLPLDQASQAERLRISIAIGIALHPTLRVFTIRDASLLDSDSMAMVAQMAHDSGSQVWLERVGEDAAATIVIEDGEVRE